MQGRGRRGAAPAAYMADGALEMGATSVEAVLAVNKISTECGFGVDAFWFDYGPGEWKKVDR